MTCKYCNSPNVTKFSSYEYYDVFECNNCNKWFWKSIQECCRKPKDRIVVQHIDFNIYQIRVQCDICGGCLNMKKPLSHEKYSHLTKGEFSTERFNNWKTSKNSEQEYIFETSKNLKFLNSNYGRYTTHLQSFYWKKIRAQALSRDRNLCQSCKKSAAQDVHHLTYRNLGQEKVEDLLSLCRRCHEIMHLV